MMARIRAPERLIWAADLIDLKPTDQLLEVGCGSGQLLALVSARVPSARLTGIDRSRQKVDSAQLKLDSMSGIHRVHVQHLSLVGAAAHAASSYDVVVAVNVNTFWVDPTRALPALRSLVSPRGRAYLIFEPPSAASLRRIRAELGHSLVEHGFSAPSIRTTEFVNTYGVCLETSRLR